MVIFLAREPPRGERLAVASQRADILDELAECIPSLTLFTIMKLADDRDFRLLILDMIEECLLLRIVAEGVLLAI